MEGWSRGGDGSSVSVCFRDVLGALGRRRSGSAATAASVGSCASVPGVLISKHIAYLR